MILAEVAPRCENAQCTELQRVTWKEMFMQGATWSEMQALECTACQEERRERARVSMSDDDPRFQQQPFEAAPYIHPHNVPKYYALQLRACEYAKQRRLCVNWVVAHDKPLHQDDQALSADALDKKRKRWLGYHDQKTSGIMGLFPLIQGLPIRLSDTVNRDLKLCRHRRGVVTDWTLHDDEASPVVDGERVLQFQPKCIYVKFEGESWQVKPPGLAPLEPGVYPLQPTTKVWTIDEDAKIKAKRTGFLATPDFCRTAYNEQGASEAAAIVGCLEVQHTSKLGDQLASYVGVSRLKVNSGLLVMQTFSPGLFAHGPPPGPDILMRLLRGELTVDEVDAEFERMEHAKK